jgi:hypothetical protein
MTAMPRRVMAAPAQSQAAGRKQPTISVRALGYRLDRGWRAREGGFYYRTELAAAEPAETGQACSEEQERSRFGNQKAGRAEAHPRARAHSTVLVHLKEDDAFGVHFTHVEGQSPKRLVLGRLAKWGYVCDSFHADVKREFRGGRREEELCREFQVTRANGGAFTVNAPFVEAEFDRALELTIGRPPPNRAAVPKKQDTLPE